MKIAIVHDWLTAYAGAERVLGEMLQCFPQADIFSLVDFMRPESREFLCGHSITTSFLQRAPLARRHYRGYLPLMPLAIEQFDLSAYDLIISSSHAVAKGVLTGPDQLHLCMCYSPIRYAWDLQHQYLRETGLDRGPKGWLARWILHKVRLWDSRTANGVDRFIAISHYIARRIRKVYGRDSSIIYPPVDTSYFTPEGSRADFYLTASRMVPYKRVDLVVEAFNEMPDRRLVVIGEGPEYGKVKKMARSNVQLLGHQPREVLREHLRAARAFVFAAEEDFGIAPLEAQACGTPVVAFGKGGVRETIVPYVPGGRNAEATGIFFGSQEPGSLRAAIDRFERHEEEISGVACRANAERFSPVRFRREFAHFVERAWREHVREVGWE